MNDYTATEIAYKNGYNQALKDFADMVTAKADLIRVNDFEDKWTISSDELDQIAEEMERK